MADQWWGRVARVQEGLDYAIDTSVEMARGAESAVGFSVQRLMRVVRRFSK